GAAPFSVGRRLRAAARNRIVIGKAPPRSGRVPGIVSKTARTAMCAAAATLSCLCLTVTTGCAHRVGSSGTIAAPSGEVSPITSKELRKYDDRDVYTAISILRPSFLTNRGQTSILLDSPAQPEVFIDGMFFGAFDTLRRCQSTKSIPSAFWTSA